MLSFNTKKEQMFLRMNKKMEFKPEIHNNVNIKLPKDILDLSEQLAEHAHNVWADGRLKEGWVYGDSRNDEKKTHPCLVPYKDLPEEEKEYDRKISQETLKLILSLGYEMKKK